MTSPDFSAGQVHATPFPHFRVPELLSNDISEMLLSWLETGAPWRARIAEFYEQNEFSMLEIELPGGLNSIISGAFVSAIEAEFRRRLDAPALKLVDLCAHRLDPGQTIRIHNDHVGDEETHRLVVQLNRGWSAEQGGLVMLFERDDPDSVTDVMLPVHRSALGFQISERSHHAVSTIHSGYRHTLVYTFRNAA